MRAFIAALGLIFVTGYAQAELDGAVDRALRSPVEVAFKKLIANGFEPTEEIVSHLTKQEALGLIEKVLDHNNWSEEAALQFQSQLQIARRAYRTGRDAGEYASAMGSRIGLEFLLTLHSLGRMQKWLDGGSGEGMALRRYLRGDTAALVRHNHFVHRLNAIPLSKRANVLGITFSSKPSTVESLRANSEAPLNAAQLAKFKEIKNRRLDQISDEEIGKVDLITDFYGIFSYDADPMAVLNRYLDRLNKGGKIFVFTDSVFVGSWNTSFGTWLKWQNIPGLEVFAEGKAFSITKLVDQIQLPPAPVMSIDETKLPIRKRLKPCEAQVTAVAL